MTLLDQALAIAATGVPVFPCGANKAPVCVGGFNRATCNPASIRALFAHRAAVLIGMPTGPASGVVVIDIDPRHDGNEWLEANRYRLPATRTHGTMSGGFHLVFNDSGHGIRNSAGLHKNGKGIAPGVDVRGAGGYVCIPPSPGYTITDDAPRAEVPAWLVALCNQPREPVPLEQLSPRKPRVAVAHGDASPYGRATLESACHDLSNAPEGAKHETINREAYSVGGLVSAGHIPQGEAVQALEDALRDLSARGTIKDMRAAERTLRAAFQQGMGKPRDVPERPENMAVDLSNIAPFIKKLAEQEAAKKQTVKKAEIPAGVYNVDGLLKALCDDCLAGSYRPQKFLSLAAAISTVATAAGRRYCTTTGLRPNLYLIAVAPSGAGKDYPLDYSRRVLSAAGLSHYLGGETIASGAGIFTSLAGHPVKLFCLDEMGMMLQAITGKKAAPYQAEIMASFMKLFSRAKSVFLGKEYANQKENPRIDIQQPHLAIFGATTPGTLWSALEAGALVDGSIARFMVFASDAVSVPRNKNMPPQGFAEEILERLNATSRGAEGHDYGNLSETMQASVPITPYGVPYAPDAAVAMDDYLDKQEAWQARANSTTTPARAGEGEIVARLGEHCQKLALVSAISRNSASPIIEKRDVEWAALLTDFCVNTLLGQTSLYVSDNEYEKKLMRVYDLVTRFGPITERNLIRRGFKYSDRERSEILGTLATGGFITATKTTPGAEGGRSTVIYSASNTYEQEAA